MHFIWTDIGLLIAYLVFGGSLDCGDCDICVGESE